MTVERKQMILPVDIFVRENKLFAPDSRQEEFAARVAAIPESVGEDVREFDRD
jgi:hypothetical protein